jgi:hypothetical protein
MFSAQCVNPDCAAPFDYRRGRLFRFFTARAPKSRARANSHCVRHFWLCSDCMESYELEYREGNVTLLPAQSHIISGRVLSNLSKPASIIGRLPCVHPRGLLE